jgi:CubicO group peptidase (beta-lactamase class C family)
MLFDGLQDFLEGHGFAGVVDIRRSAEVLYAGAHGLASPRWGVANTLATRFDTASITKLFTAVAVLQLVGQGRLALDDSIHDHTNLAGTTIPRDVTLRHLLTHTSGIADLAEEDLDEAYAEIFRAHPCHVFETVADFLPLFAGKPPHCPPGEVRRYCNAGYLLAGLAVEGAAGIGYQEYVEAEVFVPAGMSCSGFFDKRYAIEDLAEGFDPDDAGRLEQNIYAYPPRGAADGGAFCTSGAAPIRTGRACGRAAARRTHRTLPRSAGRDRRRVPPGLRAGVRRRLVVEGGV